LGRLATTGSIVGAVTNEGFFEIVNANTAGITSITNDGTSGPGITIFFGANTAGTATIINQFGGSTAFRDTSSAGSAKITNQLNTMYFGVSGGNDTSTAGNATITNNDGSTVFLAHTDAGTANITNHNGGGAVFEEFASAASATIVNDSYGVTAIGKPGGTDTPTAAHATITNNFQGETDFNAFASAGQRPSPPTTAV